MWDAHDTKQDDVANYPLVAVAIDRDKGSQNALKWAVDNLGQRGQIITLVHVNTKFSSTSKNQEDSATGYKMPTDPQMKELFLPFRCFCTRKDIHCRDIVLEETDVAKAVVEFVTNTAIEKLVVGAPSRGGFVRFKSTDISNSISKGAPDFCTVYVISKGKVSSMRNAVRPAPAVSPFRAQIQNQVTPTQIPMPIPTIPKPETTDQRRIPTVKGGAVSEPYMSHDESIKSPFTRGSRGSNAKSYTELSFTDSDMSYVSSGRPSVDRMYPTRLSGMSSASDSFEMGQTPNRSMDSSFSTGNEFSSYSSKSSYSQSSSGTGASWSSNTLDDVDAEMKRLKLELKQTMDMYSSACKEALNAKQRAMELHRWKMEEQQRLEEARIAEEAALAMVEKERAKCRAAIEAADASRRIAELEAQKRVSAEKSSLSYTDLRYRRYGIEEIEKATDYFADNRKVGEGGYGPVYKAYLDHTHVAIKVLRADAAQGKSQFNQEIEVLSCIRHPNMVLLLGACPEYGCLVYEYMANGSLEDRLFRKGGSPVIPWQHRFRIAAEIASGLLFLHQTKPEPLVHRDLKPANILLDRNYVSKISDVGLARLVPPSVADNVTQYLMTSTAGTFCYIDPEYQQTGMLGVKSDIYSLGIMLLQIITAKAPMGLTHVVSRSIEKGTFHEVLDQEVKDWPVEEALVLAEMALKCAELRRKDRPDLATVVLPELDRLRSLGEDSMQDCALRISTQSSPMHSQTSQGAMSESGYDSSRSR